jgi:cell division transport system permease protein
MIQLWRVIQQGGRNFMRNMWLSTAATVVMTVTLTIIIISFISNSALTSTIKGVTDKIDVSIYLKDTVTAEQRDLIRNRLEATGNVQEITYITKDAALARFKEKNKNDALQLQAIEETGNTLPASYSVKLKDRNKLDSVLKVTTDPAIRPLLDDKNPASITGARKDAINNIIKGSNFVIKLGLLASVVFVTISTLIIFNTIRMAIFTRRDEIEIMKLVGATKWFIRGPFVFEATLYGIIAAIIATILSYMLLLGVGPGLSNYVDVESTTDFFRTYPALIILGELLVGICIGAFSSLLAMSRYLKL